MSLDTTRMRLAAEIAAEHGLTLYDAASAAVARSNDGLLATLDRELLAAGLGLAPSAVLERIRA